ncbi:MAG: glycosyltransferase [Terracidiphilus sp.]|nr:glycosyltransferase [Terracidiphilus sp.]
MVDSTPQLAFYGYVFAGTGYGTAARAYVHALIRASVPLSIVSLDRFHRSGLHDPIVFSCLADRSRSFAPEVHLWHTEPNNVMRLKRSFPRLAVLTTWETESLPQAYVEALNHAGEVWVPSRYNAEAFRRQLSVPVFRLPHPVSDLAAPRFDANAFDREMNIPDGSFLCTAIGTWQERKNFDGIIEAFLRAFPSNKDAYLLLKTSFPFTEEHTARAQIAAAIQRANPPDRELAQKRILVFPYRWPDDCISSLLHRADCYISLHRGEGWCYPLFDAASIGVPIVATAYSGPMDYLDPAHHRLVGYSLTAAGLQQHTIHFGFDSSMYWAEPDVADAARQLRAVYENRAAARKLALDAAACIRKTYSLDAIGSAARKRLLSINKQALRIEAESLSASHWAGYAEPAVPLPVLTKPGKAAGLPSSLLACN